MLLPMEIMDHPCSRRHRAGPPTLEQTRETKRQESAPVFMTLQCIINHHPKYKVERTSLVTGMIRYCCFFRTVHCWDRIQSGQHLYLNIQSHSATQNNALVGWSLPLSPMSSSHLGDMCTLLGSSSINRPQIVSEAAHTGCKYLCNK